jgi:hypothetical protein
MAPKKALIFDASSLISLAMNGLLPELEKLKGVFNGKFLIPQQVYGEAVLKPLNIKRFEFEALRVKDLVDRGILELPKSLGISDEKIEQETNYLMETANNIFYGDGKPIHLIDLGETACLALSKELANNKIKNVLIVDERTTRLLGENPERLRKILKKKLHMGIKISNQNIKLFKGFQFLRSSELMYIAYKKDLLKIKHPKVLDAVLYALKFKGCAISDEEIKKIEKIARV